MKYIERLLRYIFWVAATAALAWLAKKIFTSAAQRKAENSRAAQQSGAESAKAKKLYRDPVCGTYVAEDISQTLSLGQSSENLHFCSRDCMEQYRRGRRTSDAETDGGRGGRVAAGA